MDYQPGGTGQGAPTLQLRGYRKQDGTTPQGFLQEGSFLLLTNY